jgi:hypothetical protein
LYPIYDYENFEFKSPVNPWSPQPKYAADFEKTKCLEFTLTPGKTLFIPAYWWYSIKFNKGTSISCFNYRTYMNNAAVLPYICMHALQIQNVKRNTVKKASIQELNQEPVLTETSYKKEDLVPTNEVSEVENRENLLPTPIENNNVGTEIN